MALKFGVIEQIVFFKASTEEIWDTLLDPDKHREFTGSPATTSAREGATFTAWNGYITGKNLELVRAKKIVQEWKTTEWPGGYPVSRLEFTLTPKNGGTEVKMVHSEVPEEEIGEYSSGWKSAYWDPLSEYLAARGAAAVNRGRRKARSMASTRNNEKKRRGKRNDPDADDSNDGGVLAAYQVRVNAYSLIGTTMMELE